MNGEPGHSVDPLLDLLAAGLDVYDLGRPLFAGVPQSPQHPEFRLVVPRRHGDLVRADGSSGASDLLITGSHVGTHIDALCHISYRGLLHGGADATTAQTGGRFSVHGMETVAPIVARGLLLDVPRALSVDACPGGYEVTPGDLERALALTGVRPARGDVLVVRTGWGRRFDDRRAFEGEHSGTPGPGEAGARWLADHEPRAVGGDTIAFERIPGGTADYTLPAHRLLLVERGIHIVEVLDLEQLAADAIHVFTFVLAPLKLVGATGSPARPIALVARDAGRREAGRS